MLTHDVYDIYTWTLQFISDECARNKTDISGKPEVHPIISQR